VPLIVSWKSVTPAGRIDREHLVSALMYCDDLRLRRVKAGRNARDEPGPIIEKPDQRGHEYVVSEMAGSGGRSFMVRTKKYKYMVFPPQTARSTRCSSTWKPTPAR